MRNSEGRRDWSWLASPCWPIASRLILLLVFAALLALPIPTAQAAGCTHYDVDVDGSPLYVIVPKRNFVSGEHIVYKDQDCQIPEYRDVFNPSIAFAKRGRKAMEICEVNESQPVSQVSGAGMDNTYYCDVGKRKGPRRQRRQHLFRMQFHGDAQGALAYCKELSRGKPNHSQPNHVEGPTRRHSNWDCYRVWKVNKKYLERVGA
ncbi:MAG: hypothetical protein OXG85_09820 [Chloroflexi bacterium]|nr:hypothetical protein [Chloroflexota bacterium]